MVLWLLSVAVLAQDAPVWTPYAKLQDARSNACAVRLSEPGRVLISGGTAAGDVPLASVEILSPEGVTRYASPLNNARSGHTCTLLRDGRVLVTGGAFQGANAEVYDPANDFWLPVPSSGPSRAGSTATMLPDGRVLVTGGYTADGTLLPYVEIFDPASNRFTGSKGQLNNPRRDHAAAALPDGRVAISGGIGLDGAALRSVEYFDPVTSIIWTGPELITARRGHAATSLEDGRILVTGGVGLNTAETLDPQGLRWTTLAARLTVPARSGHSSFVIPGNGNVLLSGGAGTAAAEWFVVATNRFETLAGTGFEDLSAGAIAAVDDGTVLLAGGTSAGSPQDACLRLNFPALTFSAAVMHPREMARVAGRNLPPNTPIQLQLEFVRTNAANQTVTVSPGFRMLTPRATTGGDGSFAAVPLLDPLNSDTGSRMRLTATAAGANGVKLVREVPVKYYSELTFGIPPSTVEGQNVALNVLVTPIEGAPRPSGPITTTFGPLTMVDVLNSVTSQTSYPSAKLPTGALSVTSVYVGDDYYDAVTQRTSLGVASRTPVIDVVTSTLTPQIGVSFTIYAQVRVDAASAVAGAPAPNGKVIIYESGVPIGEAKLQWSTNFPQPQMMASLDFTAVRFEPPLRFTASYQGDAVYRAATVSNVVSPVVQRAVPNLQVSAVPSIFNLNPAPGSIVRFHCDVPVPFNVVLSYPATLTLGATAYTMTATLPSGSTVPIGSGNLAVTKEGSASAVLSATLPNDTIRVQASFGGDGSLRPVTSPWLPMQIIPAPVQVAVAVSPVNPETDVVTLSATVKNDAGRGCQIAGPTGSVEFFLGANSLGLMPLNADGTATLRLLRPLIDGPVSIFARYNGDPLHTQSDSPVVTVTFNAPE